MSTSQQVRVLLVGGYAVMRTGLRAFLAAYGDLCVVGEARDADEAEQLCSTTQPDIILLDVRLPADGALVKRLRGACTRTHVLALADDGDESLAQSSIQAGALACLPKSVGAAELADVIRHAHSGWHRVPAGAAQLLRNPPGPALTSREREVLALMSEGLHNNEIAKRLVISSATVKFHVSSILAKLGAATRTEAVAIAVERHLATARHEPRD